MTFSLLSLVIQFSEDLFSVNDLCDETCLLNNAYINLLGSDDSAFMFNTTTMAGRWVKCI